MEMRKLQKVEECHTSKAAFRRLIREEMANWKPGMLVKPEAVEAVQVASEDHLHRLFQGAAACAAHMGRKTITVGDFELIGKLDKIRNG